MPLIQWIMQNLNAVTITGVVVGGEADCVIIKPSTVSGGVIVSGTSIPNVVYNVVGDGGIVGGGHVDPGTFPYVVQVGGGIVAGGEAAPYVFTPATGGVVLGGSTAPVVVVNVKGGAVLGGDAGASIKIGHITLDLMRGGVVIGGSGSVSMDFIEPCYKDPLPNHPKPSTADYSSVNVAPLIEFFTPIVSGIIGQNLGVCEVVFRYENNTPASTKTTSSFSTRRVSASPTPRPTLPLAAGSPSRRNCCDTRRGPRSRLA